MPRFFSDLLPPEEARAHFLPLVQAITDSERIQTEQAVGRVIARPYTAPHDLPEFRRSTVDGYAILAADTGDASIQAPITLKLVGEVGMGVQTSLTVEKGSLAAIHTGGSLPEGADAVVMLEDTERDGEWIRVRQAVKPGDNLIEVGEDIRGGAEVIPKGHRLREPDIGGLLALGFTEVDVVRQARIAVFASGDEVVAPGSATGPGQVRDINSYTIAAQAHSAGAVPLRGDILPDRFDVAFAAVNNAYQQGADMIVMSAGSSVSDRDQTPDIFNALGEPGVLIHGLATRPGKPTLLGMAGRVPLIGLPGNPVSAMVQFLMNAVPVIYALHGAALPPSAMVRVRLDGEIKSADWREDYLPARLIQRDGETLAKPLYFKSNLIFSMVHAHGLVKVPIGTGDVGAGEWVEMRLF